MKSYDKTGREIMPGDTLKIFHFTGHRRKRYYLYRYVIGVTVNRPSPRLVISNLDLRGSKYEFECNEKVNKDIEIVQGYGDNGCTFEDRKQIGKQNETKEIEKSSDKNRKTIYSLA